MSHRALHGQEYSYAAPGQQELADNLDDNGNGYDCGLFMPGTRGPPSPMSPYISPSPHISLHLPRSPHISPGELFGAAIVAPPHRDRVGHRAFRVMFFILKLAGTLRASRTLPLPLPRTLAPALTLTEPHPTLTLPLPFTTRHLPRLRDDESMGLDTSKHGGAP